MTSHVFSIEKEYFRLVAQIYYTEEGAYKELPVDIDSSYLQLEVVYYIIFATASGELRMFPLANNPAMDKDGVTGGPVEFGSTLLFTEPGLGTLPLTLSRNYNPRLTATERTRMDSLWDNVLASGNKWYE